LQPRRSRAFTRHELNSPVVGSLAGDGCRIWIIADAAMCGEMSVGLGGDESWPVASCRPGEASDFANNADYALIFDTSMYKIRQIFARISLELSILINASGE